MTYEEIFNLLDEAVKDAGDCLADMTNEDDFREMAWYFLGKIESITAVLKGLQRWANTYPLERSSARNALKIQLDDGAFMPERAHPEDAGLDIFTPRKEFLPAHRSVTIDTGVHIQLPEGTAGVLMSKSGLNANHGITSTGLIDEGYTGTIKVKLYNHSTINYEFQPGDKISQLVIVPVQRPVPVQVDEITGGARGADGFGSTGK